MLTLQSPVFHDHGRLPARYTCEGSEISPPLRWIGVPDSALSLTLILEDPEASRAASGRPVLVHWIAFNLPRDIEYLGEGVDVNALHAEAGEGLNDRQQVGYLPPCPPGGPRLFVFRLHALDTVLEGLQVPRRHHVEAAMSGHVLETAELTATFECSD